MLNVAVLVSGGGTNLQALIDAGHYGTEYIFMDAMKKELTQAFPELKISCAEVKSPYTIL